MRLQFLGSDFDCLMEEILQITELSAQVANDAMKGVVQLIPDVTSLNKSVLELQFCKVDNNYHLNVNDIKKYVVNVERIIKKNDKR